MGWQQCRLGISTLASEVAVAYVVGASPPTYRRFVCPFSQPGRRLMRHSTSCFPLVWFPAPVPAWSSISIPPVPGSATVQPLRIWFAPGRHGHSSNREGAVRDFSRTAVSSLPKRRLLWRRSSSDGQGWSCGAHHEMHARPDRLPHCRCFPSHSHPPLAEESSINDVPSLRGRGPTGSCCPFRGEAPLRRSLVGDVRQQGATLG